MCDKAFHNDNLIFEERGHFFYLRWTFILNRMYVEGVHMSALMRPETSDTSGAELTGSCKLPV